MTALLLTLLLAAPVTAPAENERPVTRRADLEAVVADLAEQVAELRREVRDLRRRLEDRRPPPEVLNEVKGAVGRDELVVGMTREEARRVIGRLGWAYEVDREERQLGERTVRIETWDLGDKRRLAGLPHLLVFENGTLVRVRR